MVTDYKGRIITPEQAKGLERFQYGRASVKLKYPGEFSTTIGFEIDEAWQQEHEEDADVYGLILPPQISHNYFDVREGDVFTFSKQYDGEIARPERIIKRFRVSKVDKEIDHDATKFWLCITASVVPID